MSNKVKSAKTNLSVEDVIAALGDEQTISDSRTLMGMMHRISGSQPKLWNVGTIGFDEYHYRYERLGDVELPILEKILEQSYQYLKAQSGHMHRVK